MDVSVVIPAHNAAETLAETLESLQAQTHPDWEAIVVNDGSSDKTAAIAARFARRDRRIRTVRQRQSGVSAARNKGIRLARYDWLLFLDADDWLSPLYLERMTGALAENPDLDAVHCGWVRVAPNGKVNAGEYCNQSGDLFDAFARYPAFAIHACIVRRSLVEAVGGFDPALLICQDWDLWQRIARTGAQFGRVGEALAFYRMRPGSVSSDGRRFLEEGLGVITRGHSPDPRVPNPHPSHVDGRPANHFSAARVYFACYAAGLAIGRHEDARSMLDALQDDLASLTLVTLDRRDIAKCLFEATPLPSCRSSADWIDLWPGVERRIEEFLLALEERTQIFGLNRQTRLILERLVLEQTAAPYPVTIGNTHAIRVEVTERIPDLVLPSPCEHLHCAIELEGTHLGTIELPICNGLVPGYVLADAIAARFAWPILGRFFEHTVYPNLRVEPGWSAFSLYRGALCLAEGLPGDVDIAWPEAHDQVGWAVFLQEIWGRPEWPDGFFYDPQIAEQALTHRCIADSWLAIEVSEELPDLEIPGQELDVLLTVGGVAIGVVTLPIQQNRVRAQELRAALTSTSGFELCRAAVREGMLGQPLEGSTSLRERLAAAASEAARHPDWLAAPGSARVPGQVPSLHEHSIVLGRRAPGTFGASASRRALLPAEAARELVDGASVAGEPIVCVPRPGVQPEHVVYAPDLIWRPSRRSGTSAVGSGASGAKRARNCKLYGMAYFETLFATRPDPWRYTSPYEQTKYEQTLALLPSTPIERALELGCAEGHFSVQLAPHTQALVAADISQIALSRAADRCAGLENVRFVHLDVTADPLPGRFDLIVCSEVLYYLDDRETLRTVAGKLADALEPGGHLLTAHSHLVVDEPDQAGFDWDHPFGAKVIGETLASVPSLHLVKELRTPLYRIQLFQRDASELNARLQAGPEILELAEQPTARSLDLMANVLWHGGSPWRSGENQLVATYRLPILMYHRVAIDGPPATARYRVTPEAFEEQLRYLYDAGFYGIGLEEWYAAMQARRPLPGRAILITFDDGYSDFATHAWPLLKRYGFSATVFLVADAIGKSASWDRIYGEDVPLLGWPEICQLQDEGVTFGSHAAIHRPLTALSLEQIVREGARSRAILERGLGEPVMAFAYPYGDVDPVVQHLVGACGYTFGLSCWSRLSQFQDDLLVLPRIEVTGFDNLASFVAKLSP